MPHPEVESLIADLRAWIKAEHGRSTQIATMLGVSRSLVSDWISPRRKVDPQLEEFLKLKEFLKREKRKKK